MAAGEVTIAFHRPAASNATRKRTDRVADRTQSTDQFSNPNASTNMTMIVRVQNTDRSADGIQTLKVYVGDELAAVAEPIDSLYFITIQSDQVGELRFELDGQMLVPMTNEQSPMTIGYSTNAHHGSLQAPVVLKPADETGVYKLIEEDHVVIIRIGQKYDVTGKKLR